MLAAGLGCGLLGAAAVARLLEHQIHGVRPFDVSTLVATCALMTMAGLFASWWPARRAATRNPNVALNES